MVQGSRAAQGLAPALSRVPAEILAACPASARLLSSATSSRAGSASLLKTAARLGASCARPRAPCSAPSGPEATLGAALQRLIRTAPWVPPESAHLARHLHAAGAQPLGLPALALRAKVGAGSGNTHPAHASRTHEFASATSYAEPRGAERLRRLNAAGEHRKVIRQYEEGLVEADDAAVTEYIKALVFTGRLDGSRVARVLARHGGDGVAEQLSSAAPRRPRAPLSSEADFGAAHDEDYGRAGPRASGGAQALLRELLADGTLASSGAGARAGAGGGGSGTAGTRENPVVVSVAQETRFWPWFWKTVQTAIGWLLFLSFLGVVFEQSSRGGLKGVLQQKSVTPQVETSTTFKDVKGVDEAKNELEEIVEYLKDPKRFTKLGGKLPKGVLLVGPPGTGKTMLARAIAGEAGVPFFYASGSEFDEMFVGVGSRRVRELFEAARKHSPCIVFLDEIDAIGGKRSSRDERFAKMTLNQLLVELDGFKATEGIICIAATNVPDALDKALVRPGRFDRHVVVPNPDVEGRRQILEVHGANINLAPDVDWHVIARGTPGFSGAELANVVNIGALKAARENKSMVSMEDIEYAKDRVMMGAERKSAVISEKNRRLTAYHEGGHALVALFTEGSKAIHKATIVPRGMALGMVMQLPEADQTSISRRELLAELDVLMGGRVAEELIYGDSEVTTGASNDLQRATALARQMVTRYGFGSADGVGQLVVDWEREAVGLSPEAREKIEKDTRKLLTTAYERAKQILTQHQKELHLLATALIENETLTGKQIRELVKTGKLPGAGGGDGGSVAAAASAQEGAGGDAGSAS
ncbi:unnamed protein product [Pedinophyceae sp. YPF-701]|nr:unnamed protein product [Pedinophyceae sp. YPF-701]